MNIEDVKSDEKDVENVDKKIFMKQLELVKKYKEIEKLPDWPLNLNLYEHQIIIKDFKQRGMEEIAEAYEAYDAGDIEHFKEELIDALHFLVELNILVGKDFNFFTRFKNKKRPKPVPKAALMYRIGLISVSYGLVCNCLKNKPWKQTQMQTDEKKFYTALKRAYLVFQRLFYAIGMDRDDIYNYYFRKHKVNEFRIDSKY